jgi:hypothetical protein
MIKNGYWGNNCIYCHKFYPKIVPKSLLFFGGRGGWELLKTAHFSAVLHTIGKYVSKT